MAIETSRVDRWMEGARAIGLESLVAGLAITDDEFIELCDDHVYFTGELERLKKETNELAPCAGDSQQLSVLLVAASAVPWDAIQDSDLSWPQEQTVIAFRKILKAALKREASAEPENRGKLIPESEPAE